MSSIKRLIIVCEGKTEQDFCHKVLYPYFVDQGIFIEAPQIGGIVSWQKLKFQIQNHLKEGGEPFVTTFIDYYALPTSYPNREKAEQVSDKVKRMQILEQGMLEALNNELRFIPYIQLHEFEALLFYNIDIFDDKISSERLNKRKDIISILEKYPNSEDINNRRETAPSKRLEKHIKHYKKRIDGIKLAESIGLNRMREKCPHFDGWIEKLESLANK